MNARQLLETVVRNSPSDNVQIEPRQLLVLADVVRLTADPDVADFVDRIVSELLGASKSAAGG